MKNLDKIFSEILKIFIYIYRFFSKIKPATCRFYPTCSKYAIDALTEKGIKGIPLIIYRIIRCNPFNDGGYDPIKKGVSNG